MMCAVLAGLLVVHVYEYLKISSGAYNKTVTQRGAVSSRQSS